MKKLIFLPLFLCLLTVILSCEKEIKITGTPSPLVSLNDVRALYTGSPKVLTMDDMLGASYISGVVISDPANGNAPEGLVILQSFKRKLLRGIALEMGAAAAVYNPGDSLVVKIDGKTLDRVSGMLQISDVSVDDVERVSTGHTQHINITTTTFTDITRWMDMYESTLVSVKSVIAPDLVLGDVFEGAVTISDWSNTMSLITQPTASFAANLVPGFGDYIGVMMRDSADEPILMLRNADDYEAQALEPYNPAELYANFPEGWENVIGARKGGYGGTYESHPTGEWQMPNSYTLNSANIINKTGTWAVMMRNGFAASVGMNFNLPYGASRLYFEYGAATTNAADTGGLPATVTVEYSQDSGDTWTKLGDDLLITSVTTKYIFDMEVDIKGPVRFRITKNLSTSRTFVDQIGVYQNNL
ncbi:MAG TPA: DUF5689 domain-containing protein [Sphingobacterium sp.]|nr:DUF5689 domain-containing protein [Sphingobacterium sp.]